MIHPTCRALVPLLVFFQVSSLEAQQRRSDSPLSFAAGRAMLQAVSKIVTRADSVSGVLSFGWNDGICILGAMVRPGKSVAFELPLRVGARYVIIGAGDDDAEDVDVRIYDARRNLVAEDREVDDRPLVLFAPNAAGNYTLTVELYRAPVYCAVALAILTDSGQGYKLPLRNVVAALRNNLTQAVSVSVLGKIRYHDYDNQWALFGQVLPQNRSMSVSNMTMESGTHLFAAAGDDAARDLDLFVRRRGIELGSDEDLDATPLLLRQTAAGGEYEIEVKNVRSNGPSLVLVSILE